MYDNYLQFYVFSVCSAVGVVVAALYEPIAFLKSKRNNFKIWIAPDFVYSVFACFLFLAVAYLFDFPDFRGYMLLGVGVGIIAENKSLHYYLHKSKKRYIIRKNIKSSEKDYATK